MRDPLNATERKEFEETILKTWRQEYVRALASGAFPESFGEPGDHRIAKIALRRVGGHFSPHTDEAREAEANYAKFTQNPTLMEELNTYGDREIVEASPEDKIWGIGLHETDERVHDKSQWQGLNWLGECIMRVRDQLVTESV